MKTIKKQFGDLGEQIAQKYLKKNKYQILEQNFQKPWGEIDIIAKLGNDIIFIEVKTKSAGISDEYGLPEEEVNYWKQKKLIRTAETYLMEKDFSENVNWQIDVIAILLYWQTRKAKLRHLKNAVY
ncbi:YraN family protein [bacterium]|nr:YraN family protein [bacterium]|tara:strand:- start:28412 stop:28789 length:378 start_codon:yes stop_codon:yes gene_type:complete